MALRRQSTELSFRRQPPLRLFGLPGPEQERLDVVTARKHPAPYAIAAFAWHHGERLDPAARHALLGAMLLVWPRRPGRRPQDYTNHVTALLAAAGATNHEIARAWDIEPDAARKRADAGSDRTRVLQTINNRIRETGELTPGWGIEIVRGVEAKKYLRRVVPLPEPFDPGADDAVLTALRLTASLDGPEVESDRERVAAVLDHLEREGKVQVVRHEL